MPINLRVKHRYFLSFLFALPLLLSVGCSPIKNSRYEEYLSLKYEIPECNQNYTYPTTTSITGTAVFYKRGVNLVTATEVVSGSPVLKLKNMTQGDPLATPLPIKFAEVAVYDATNKIIQCGKTDILGNLKAVDGISSLSIPALAANYTVRVYSRINHTLSFGGKPDFKVNAAVKQDKYTNTVYSISSVAASNGVDDTNITLTAYARQTDSMAIEGGAFNVLNNIFLSYDYIRQNTAALDTTCLNTKLNVYWKAGYNAFQYAYPNSDPQTLGSNSFYQDNQLYITGGRLGNISFERADHFNDYVVIHEVAHSIEDVCGSLLSPGGTHYIIARVDPRLAWAEAWSNYFAAKVMNSSITSINPEFAAKMTSAGFTNTNWTYFFAAEGFSDSVQNIGSGSGFMFDIKKPGNNPDTWQTGQLTGQPFDKTDAALYPGEGHFREGAITRGLFKLSTPTATCGTECISTTPISFDTIWKAMSRDVTYGMGNSANYIFKSSVTFLEQVKKIITDAAGSWATYKTFIELPTSDALDLFSDGRFTTADSRVWTPYGTKLTIQTFGDCAGTANTYKIQPRTDDPVLTSTNSDQRYSNHFYNIDFNSLAGLNEINVNFTKITGTDIEFDLLLFTEDYFFNGDYFCPSLDANGACTVSYQPSRTTNQYVVKSDRRSGAIALKSLRDLQTLDLTKRYLLNIRAYTANKSITSTTEYSYTIKDQYGANICP